MSLVAELLRIAMPQARALPTKWAVIAYTWSDDPHGEPDGEPTEWEFDTFDEAANKAEDLDAIEDRPGHWYGVDEVEVPE